MVLRQGRVYLHKVLRERTPVDHCILSASDFGSSDQFHSVSDLLRVLDRVDTISQSLAAGVEHLQIRRGPDRVKAEIEARKRM